MELLELLKQRYEVSKSFTKIFHDEVKRCVEDYALTPRDRDTMADFLNNAQKRYEFKIPYIFATHESMTASMFDQIPDLVFRGRGLLDEDKKQIVEASYDYLTDVCDMERIMTESAWWFILVGFASAEVSWKAEAQDVPMLDDNGMEMMDENGENILRSEYLTNDPVVEVEDPLKIYYAPESKFSEDGSKIPYKFRHALMEVDEIKEVYGKKVDTDATLKVDDKLTKSDDIKRVNVYFYYGQIPESNKKDVKDWEFGKKFYVVYTEKEILYTSEIDILPCAYGKLYGTPTEFFGFGIGRTLREFQKELSIRRGQQIRFADLTAFPKLAVDTNTVIDANAILDPREFPVVTYQGDKIPQYLVPPEMSQTLILSEQKAREDAQYVSGMLDISTGAQNTKTVSTATGQSMFADAAEKRVRQAKRQFGRFYRQLVITLLKFAQKNWDDQKVFSITDKQGNTQEIAVSGSDLADIDFEKDIDIDLESINVNKEVLRAQAIEMYDKVKDDPIVDREMVFKDLMKDGFNKKNPENYINQQAGMPIDQQPMVGDQTATDQPMVEPQGGEVPSSNSGVMGSAQ